ncbi:unnamed protein product [Oncorhynchus mykiss]|uniref:Uncharacterized protein n=1 Tax=Oncorhynchus mykiss TaxID=8022 RepID=A0A060XSE2_ONCMY|nr:unnamed protein product [Oncorhynchus mykiss]
MFKLQLFRVFLNERLTAAAVDIFGAVEKTVVEYQEENDRLRRLLGITPELITPELQLCRTGGAFSSPQFIMCAIRLIPEHRGMRQNRKAVYRFV